MVFEDGHVSTSEDRTIGCSSVLSMIPIPSMIELPSEQRAVLKRLFLKWDGEQA